MFNALLYLFKQCNLIRFMHSLEITGNNENEETNEQTYRQTDSS